MADSDDIRYVHIADGANIGDKRNLGSELATGEIIASWDDDDWNGPDRLASQLSQLGSKSVAGYCSMYFTDGVKWWEYRGGRTTNLGTSLLYRKEWWVHNNFPHRQVCEDGEFIHKAIRANQYTCSDAGHHLVASIHRGNTSPRTLTGQSWRMVADPQIEGYWHV